LNSLLDVKLFQRPLIGTVNELYFFAGVVAASTNGLFYDDVKFIGYDLVLRRVLEAGEEGGDVDEREGGRKCRYDGCGYLQNG